MSFPILLAQVEAEKTLSENQSVWHILAGADIVVKTVLLLLVVASVLSWALIFYKSAQIRNAVKLSQKFWGLFTESRSLDDLSEKRAVQNGPLFEIFRSAYSNLTHFRKTGRLKSVHVKLIEQKMAQTEEEELYKLEQYTPFLATVASTAPFVGLLGTVWGILTAFWKIGQSGGNTGLATVGPAISEALIATAVGLFAAIPAVMAYNFFVGRIKVAAKMMNLFGDEMTVRLEEEAGNA